MSALIVLLFLLLIAGAHIFPVDEYALGVCGMVKRGLP